MRWSSALLIAAGFGYALYAIRVLFLLRYTTVHHDFWIIYDRFFEIPFPGNVLAPENGHALVLPNLIWLANMLVFRGDETPLFLIALASLVSIAALLVDVVLRDRGRGCAESSLLIVSALAAAFWLAKLQILISAGFTMICAFPIIGLLLGVRSLTSIDVANPRRPVRWWAVWAGAVMATFSFGTGLAAWPALGLIAWARRVAWRHLGLWCLGMLICMLLIQGILPLWVPESDKAFPIVFAPLKNLRYWLELIGSPVANTWAGIAHAKDVDPILALGAGIAGMGLAAWGLVRAWKRRRDLSQVEWTGLALVLFSAFAAGLIAIARTSTLPYFPQNHFSSRYLWWTAYFWLGLIWLLARSGRVTPALRARLHLIAAVLCLAGIWPAQWEPLRIYGRERAETEYFVASLVSGVPFERFYPPLFFYPGQVFRLDASLRKRQLCYYARPGYCSVGEALDKWFLPSSETESAQMRPNHFYPSVLYKHLAMSISGWLEQGPADLILLTDEKRVVRGLGRFMGGWRAFPVDDENFFVAFAPVMESGKGFQIWAVRGRECRLVIPRLGKPKT